jgi:predicted TPR repeat methyltransferase
VKRNQAKRRTIAELVDEATKLYASGALADAEATYRLALAQQPDHPGLLNLLAVVVGDRGDPRAAVALIERAIDIAPDVAASHLNLGVAYAMVGDDVSAVASMEIAAKLEPRATEPLERLAKHHISRNRPDAARALLRRVVRRDPANEQAQFLLAGLSGEHRDAMPPALVAELFDTYAKQFDEHLVAKLEYRAPDMLAAMLPAVDRAWDVVDLGCGTGLCGIAFRDRARHLVGSDLSPRMIELARARGVYDELYAEDLLVTLRRASADVIVAADVLIYVGALEPMFAACAATLRAGGWLAFSTERHVGDGVKLQTSLRYAHSDAYIHTLAASTGFAIAEQRETVLRTDRGQPIAGTLWALQRAG